MGKQRPSQELSIKARVRRRDGNSCVVCRIEERAHEKRYGKILEVHRIVPGSKYSTEWGVCVTLCQVCHDSLHGQGNWGWIKVEDPLNEMRRAVCVRISSNQDLDEEEKWQTQLAWGAWIKGLRSARMSSLTHRSKPGTSARRRRKKVNHVERFARLSGLSTKSLLDFEAGRREPHLFEAKKLAAALNMTLDELATEKEPVEGWRTLCEERSHLRALVLRAREPEDGELECLTLAAMLVCNLMSKTDEQDAKANHIISLFE